MPSAIRNGIIALLIGSVLVVLAYFYVDRQVAFWANDHAIYHYRFLITLTRIPEVFTAAILVIYPVLVIRFCYGHFSRTDRVWLAAANSVAIATFIHTPLKIVFGRYWPATWINHNPSLLRDHVYGFHWFHFGARFASFPSGHTTVTVAAMTVIWIAYPAWRWLAALIAVAVPIGLVGMNYHFVGDVIGGGFLGALTACYTTKIMGIERNK